MNDSSALNEKYSYAAHVFILSVAKKKHNSLAKIIVKNGRIDIHANRNKSIVEFLARTVTSQALSARASNTIWCRICTLRENKSIEFSGLFTQQHYSELVSCGISHSKAKSIIEMSAAYQSGLISDDIQSADYETIVQQITSLWGFGKWSADMVAMFFARTPDIWPELDVALIRGLKILAPNEQPNEVAECYSPHRTTLARHIWKAIDNDLIG
jgi:DNA-3-methyladenine glycosylase II